MFLLVEAPGMTEKEIDQNVLLSAEVDDFDGKIINFQKMNKKKSFEFLKEIKKVKTSKGEKKVDFSELFLENVTPIQLVENRNFNDESKIIISHLEKLFNKIPDFLVVDWEEPNVFIYNGLKVYFWKLKKGKEHSVTK